MATHWILGCDANDPHRVAAFWAQALGYVNEPGYDEVDGPSIIDPDGKGPAIGFLRVPEGKTAKNRMHIDVRVAGKPPWDMTGREQRIRAKVRELVAAGAAAVGEESYGVHLVMSSCSIRRGTSSASCEGVRAQQRRHSAAGSPVAADCRRSRMTGIAFLRLE